MEKIKKIVKSRLPVMGIAAAAVVAGWIAGNQKRSILDIGDEAADAVQLLEGQSADAAETQEGQSADAAETRDAQPVDAVQILEGQSADAAETREGQSADAAETQDAQPADAAETQDAQSADTSWEFKEVALTFDDGPNPVYTPVLLDGLEKRDVEATFFLLGSQVELYPEIVAEMSRQGHQLGNHSYSHRQLSTLGEAEILEELGKTNDAIEEITGSVPEVFRPPFGSLNASMEDKIDMAEVLWDVDPLDWCTLDVDTVVRRVVEEVEDHQIILMHDASQTSVQAALRIVDILQAQGYEFVTVEEIIFE